MTNYTARGAAAPHIKPQSDRKSVASQSSEPAAVVQMPNNLEAEQATLGAMLMESAAIEHAQELLKAPDFHRENHRLIFGILTEMHGRRDHVDLITVAEKLSRAHQLDEIGGAAYLEALIYACPGAANVDSYARIVHDLSVKRRAYIAAQKFSAHALNGASPADLAATVEELARDLAAASLTSKLKFQPITAAELTSRPAPTFLVAEMLPENGLSMLMAPPGMFKSFIALSLSLSIANGLPWYGHETRQSPVLYISAEGSSGMGPRVRAWERDHSQKASDQCYFLTQPVQLMSADDVGTVATWAKRLPEQLGLIVIDTLARCSAGADENSARDMGLVIEGADTLRRETGAHVLILHHANKMGDTRGSTALPGALDTIITVKRERDLVVMKCSKQKDAAEFEPISLASRVVALDDGTTSLVLDYTTERPTEASSFTESERRTLERLPVAGATSAQWQKALEGTTPRATFYRNRDALERKGGVTTEASETGTIYHRADGK